LISIRCSLPRVAVAPELELEGEALWKRLRQIDEELATLSPEPAAAFPLDDLHVAALELEAAREVADAVRGEVVGEDDPLTGNEIVVRPGTGPGVLAGGGTAGRCARSRRRRAPARTRRRYLGGRRCARGRRRIGRIHRALRRFLFLLFHPFLRLVPEATAEAAELGLGRSRDQEQGTRKACHGQLAGPSRSH